MSLLGINGKFTSPFGLHIYIYEAYALKYQTVDFESKDLAGNF